MIWLWIALFALVALGYYGLYRYMKKTYELQHELFVLQLRAIYRLDE